MNSPAARLWRYEALCQGLMIGFSEVLITIHLSLSIKNAVILGIFLSTPLALGALVQVIVTQCRLCKYPQHIAVTFAGIQTLGLGILASCILREPENLAILFAGLCAYWIGSLVVASPMQDLIARSVPTSIHNRYFSQRALVVTMLTLFCNIISGRILESNISTTTLGLFLTAAFVVRLISFALTMKATEYLRVKTKNQEPASKNSAVPILPLCVGIFCFRFAVNTSSPFYSAYMLNELKMTFQLYLFMTAIPLLSKMLALHNWARLLDSRRMFEALVISTFTVASVPLFWSIYQDPLWLGLSQVLSGLSWSGFELVSVLLIQQIYPARITERLGIFLAAGSLGSVAGGVLGGYLLNHGVHYAMLFAISGTLRFASGAGFLYYLRRQHLFRFHHLRLKDGIFAMVTLRPSMEAIIRLVPVKTAATNGRKKKVA